MADESQLSKMCAKVMNTYEAFGLPGGRGFMEGIDALDHELYREILTRLLSSTAYTMKTRGISMPGIAVAVPKGESVPDPLPPKLVGALNVVNILNAMVAQAEPPEEPEVAEEDQAEFANGWWEQMFTTTAAVYELDAEAEKADIARQN